MIKKTLFTGNGVSLSPIWAEGRTESRYVRLIADEGMAITNGDTVTVCVDVLAEDANNWRDCDMPPVEESEETTEADYQSALRDMGVRL